MSFHDLVAAMDQTVLSALKDDPTITIHFSGSGSIPDLTLLYITKNPAFEEDYIPGSSAQAGQGTSVLILFIHLTAAQLTSARYPLNGDTATVSGIDYDIHRVGTDREDGRTLYLRRRNQRWDG